MTAILAVHSDTSYAIGGDAGAFDEGGTLIATSAEPKVFKFGNTLVGVAGSFRIMELVAKSNIADPYKLRDHLMQILGQSNDSWSVLLVNRDGIYELGEDYSVLKFKEPYAAVGAACDIATGALAALSSFSLEPIDMVKTAMDVTEHHSTMCIKPFRFFYKIF